MNKPARSISAMLPAFNEAKNLPLVIEMLTAVLEEVAEDWEVIVVNDGSQDDTSQVIATLQANEPRVREVKHDHNQGYGAALKSGFAAAKLDWVFLMDGDGQFDAQDLKRAVCDLEEWDVIFGVRKKRSDPAARRFNSFAWQKLIQTLFGLHSRVRDINCGFKLFRRHVLEACSLQARGAMISTELVVQILQKGFRVKQMEVSHLPRKSGTPTGNNPKVIARAFVELGKLYWRLRRVPAASMERNEA